MVDIIPKEIGREDIRLLIRRGAPLIEVLPREEYDRLHLPGAVSVPLSMISRKTVDRFQWDKPVIVYAGNSLDDISARAAWRLSSLGFTQVFRYTAGKADWLANGLPIEGSEAQIPRAGDLADLDVPTCKRGERIAVIKERVRKAGWDTCVVVNDQMVVLGLLRAIDLDRADQSWPAEEVMERDPLACRLHTSTQEALTVMHARRVDHMLVTGTDGKLFGLLKEADIHLDT
jgi:rhodanese-related sulfurtransferase/CBS domain-containing protein